MCFGWWFWVISTIIAVLPDIDVTFRQEYMSLFGHRGFTHSIFFAVVVGMISAFISVPFVVDRIDADTMFSWRLWSLIAFYSGCTLSHSVQDSLVCRLVWDSVAQKYEKKCFDIGPAYLSPFSNTRNTMCHCYHPILVSPLGVRAFFTEYGLKVLLSEFYYLALPLVLLNVITYVAIWIARP